MGKMGKMIDMVAEAIAQASHDQLTEHYDKKCARAALEELRNFDTSDFTFSEAEAIKRFIDAALGEADALHGLHGLAIRDTDH